MIIVSQYGGFHARHGAESAYELNLLQLFITTYAKYSQLPSNRLCDLQCFFDLPPRIVSKLGRITGWKFLEQQQSTIHEIGKSIFAHLAASKINRQTTIFHAYSAFQEACWDRCDELGVNKVIDWGIAHPAYVNNLMAEEADRWNIPKPIPANTSRILNELYRADRIVIPSSFVENSFLKHQFPPHKLYVNPYGVSLSLFKPRLNKRLRSDPLRIAFAGALSLRKGVLYLLEAVNLLRGRSVPFELSLFSGSWEESVKTAAEKYYGCISHQGLVPHHQLADRYAQIDILVLPSLAEGMARVVIEAMACGVPCIVTPNCGYEGIITDGANGFEVPIRDSMAIADRLQLIYEQPSYLEYISNTALLTAQKQTWDRYSNGLHKLYEYLTHV